MNDVRAMLRAETMDIALKSLLPGYMHEHITVSACRSSLLYVLVRYDYAQKAEITDDREDNLPVIIGDLSRGHGLGCITVYFELDGVKHSVSMLSPS